MPTHITPVDVTPTADSTWNDVDITSHVGADAGNIAIAILEIVNTHASLTYDVGFRKNGSTDERFDDIWDDSHWWCCIGVDDSDIFESKLQNSAIEVWLTGYWTQDEAAAITNGVTYTPDTADTWIDLDVSGDTGANTATIAFFQVIHPAGTNRQWGLRENGSTDDRHNDFWDDLEGGSMALDANEICELFSEATDSTIVTYYHIGYGFDNFTSFANAKDYSTGTTGSDVETDLSTDIPSGNDGAMLQFYAANNEGGFNYGGHAKKNGQTRDPVDNASIPVQSYLTIETDGDRKIEQQISSTHRDLYLWGYSNVHVAAVADDADASLFIAGQQQPVSEAVEVVGY